MITYRVIDEIVNINVKSAVDDTTTQGQCGTSSHPLPSLTWSRLAAASPRPITSLWRDLHVVWATRSSYTYMDCARLLSLSVQSFDCSRCHRGIGWRARLVIQDEMWPGGIETVVQGAVREEIARCKRSARIRRLLCSYHTPTLPVRRYHRQSPQRPRSNRWYRYPISS